MSSAPAYAELHCLSNFTFLRGASHPEELVRRAHELGHAALALTDECSLAGVVRAHVAAKECGLRLIVGTELRLDDGLRLLLLATDRTGYGGLSSLISRGRRAAEKGRYRLSRADLADGVPGCLALYAPAGWPEAEAAHWVADVFPGRAWLAFARHLGADDQARAEATRTVAAAVGLRVLAAGDVHCHDPARQPLQDTLTAVRLRTTVAEAGRALFPNAERHLRPRERLARLYPPEWLAETLAVAKRCTFSLDELRYEYPEELVPPGLTPAAHLRALVDEGLRWRYGTAALDAEEELDSGVRRNDGTLRGETAESAKVRALVEKELALIAELRYEAYFLTVHDIVRFARSRGILCQGRGSAANSAVCYCLGITEVDPSRMSVLFERFISKERNEPPDIDVDFEHERREEVIQYIYAKYGRERAALAAAVITYRPRSAMRDVGKALGLDAGDVDRLAKSMAWWDGRRIDPERLREAGFDPAHPRIRLLMERVNELVGFPRHLTQHVGGFVIARGPLAELVPIENAAMAERTVIQWDKDDLDALGLLKVDVLALGMLTAIRRALDLANGFRGTALTVAAIPPEDPAVFAMISRGDTVGVFQIESRAQMAMLPRLRPRTFYDLVIEVAIVRPGPIQGDMVHPYLRRRQGLEPVTYPSEAVRGVLERTLGVPIFQEQVIQLAMVAAGFSGGEADRLRRAMAAWRRKGGLEPFEARLIAGMRARGYDEDFARRIYQQILGFGEYGFPESHAASFALLVYVSAWLKHHEPAAFTAALLNSQPMGFYAPAQLVQDARRHGVAVRPVDVTVSDWDCTLEEGGGRPDAVARPEDWTPVSTGVTDEEAARPSGKSAPTEDAPDSAFPFPSLRRKPESSYPDTDSDHPSADGYAQDRTPAGACPGLRSGVGVTGQIHGDGGGRTPALRLGLRLVKGLTEESARRVLAARAAGAFGSVEDVVRRATLDARDRQALAQGGALDALAGHRRRAQWQGLGVEPERPLLRETLVPEAVPLLPALGEGEAVRADYASLGLTLGRHPLALLRPRLREYRTAEDLQRVGHGRFVRAAGLVITRQRPGTASGVTFVTLEDETGTVNVIVWRDLAERQRRVLLGARLLGVRGTLERQGEVIHLVAGRLEDLSAGLGDLAARSRDFH